MRIGIVTTSIALALAAVACAQTAPPQPPQEPSAQQEPPQKPVPAKPKPPSGAPAGSGVMIDGVATDESDNIFNYQKALAKQNQAMAKAQNDLARQQMFTWRGMTALGQPDRPVVITTEPITAEIESEVKEDLTVMDKLLSDEAMSAGGDGIAPRAMGIKLSQLAMSEPMYVEGLGAMFSYRVGLPLAGGAASGEQAKPAPPPSAWENAKREIHARQNPGSALKLVESAPKLPPYDPAKVEALTRAIIKTLPEAKNIRHLKDGDVVIVTIEGNDDTGRAMRMTLKAKKSDIDQAAAGTMTTDAFAERVARRIG